ncbi:TPA: hypothetical protein ACKFN4_001985 [Neisseria gonorrhoeae]
MILWRGTRGFGIDRIKIETAASAQTSAQQKHGQHHSSLIHQWIVHNEPPIQLKNDKDYYFIYF